jgi:hypothetical protein
MAEATDSDEAYKRFQKIEEDGKKNIYKYFDRIHDNNYMIAGHFALAKIVEDGISPFNILVPVANMCFLIWIEYRMMEISRTESHITEISITGKEYKSYGKRIQHTTLWSLLTIVTTVGVTLHFLFKLFYSL